MIDLVYIPYTKKGFRRENLVMSNIIMKCETCGKTVHEIIIIRKPKEVAYKSNISAVPQNNIDGREQDNICLNCLKKELEIICKNHKTEYQLQSEHKKMVGMGKEWLDKISSMPRKNNFTLSEKEIKELGGEIISLDLTTSENVKFNPFNIGSNDKDPYINAGFEGKEDFYQFILRVDLEKEGNFKLFEKWKENDGTKAGLVELFKGK